MQGGKKDKLLMKKILFCFLTEIQNCIKFVSEMAKRRLAVV